MTAKQKGRAVPPPPAADPIATLLNTADTAEQAARIQQLLIRAQPTHTLIIEHGPDGLRLVPIGEMEFDTIYALLEQALQATRAEERRQRDAQVAALQAAAVPPDAEPATAAA